MGAAHNGGVPQAHPGTEIPMNAHQCSTEQAPTPVHSAGTCLGIDTLREIVLSSPQAGCDKTVTGGPCKGPCP
jgi:hypothetical protein